MRARDHTPSLFPDNGRTLTDDVQDAFLAILTNGKVTEDKVGPHGDLLAEFPIWGRRTTPEDSKEGGQFSLCVNGWAVDFAKFFSRRCHVTSCGGGDAYGTHFRRDRRCAIE
jgi:hypothetical protein